ncbi:MAG: GTPase HflX [Candidatus Methanomethylophilaceae archaeon]
MKNAVLLTINEETEEIGELCRSADINITATIIQRRGRPETGMFFGKGKMEEVKDIISKMDIDIVAFNGDLKPNQYYNLETFLGKTCIDRIGIILDIFTDRARDRQASLQVEMARLRYEMPMIKEWVNRQKSGEHPGFLGGGGYSTEGYLNYIFVRLKKIDDELSRIGQDIDRRVLARKKKGFHLISLCGHTNAGKSSLMSILSEEEVFVKDLMFSTLSTTTRRMKGTRKEILISDTIGFLRDLPPFLINSFKGTLSEIFLADLVLLMVDGSEPESDILEKLESSFSILLPEVEPERLVLLVNKIDSAPPELLRTLIRISMILPGLTVIPISIYDGSGMVKLQKHIEDFFNPPCSLHLRIPLEADSASFVSWLHDNSEVTNVRYDKELTVDLLCNESRIAPINERVNHFQGTVLRIHSQD